MKNVTPIFFFLKSKKKFKMCKTVPICISICVSNNIYDLIMNESKKILLHEKPTVIGHLPQSKIIKFSLSDSYSIVPVLLYLDYSSMKSIVLSSLWLCIKIICFNHPVFDLGNGAFPFSRQYLSTIQAQNFCQHTKIQ